jgi:DNA repair protein RecO (recombination protein O)
MSLNRTEAIVLNKRDFRETSLIADFYTRDFGRLSGLLKGIRQEPEKFASNLEPFSLNEIIFYRKRSSSLHLVSQCDLKEYFGAIRGNIPRTGMASFMIELISVLMPPEDPNSAVFDLAVSCLKELAVAARPDKILSIFKIKMLSLSGFKPHLDSCVSCFSPIPYQSKFSLMLGGLLCPRCYGKDLNCRTIFRGTIATIMYIERNDFKTNLNLGINPQIRKELDLILNAFFHFHLEKELKTQRLFAEMASGI